MLFCRRPCSRRVCECVCVCVCVLSVGRARITQLSSRGGHIYALNPSGRPKSPFFFLPRCVFIHTNVHVHSLTVYPAPIPTDTNEHILMFWDILWISMLLTSTRRLWQQNLHANHKNGRERISVCVCVCLCVWVQWRLSGWLELSSAGGWNDSRLLGCCHFVAMRYIRNDLQFSNYHFQNGF